MTIRTRGLAKVSIVAAAALGAAAGSYGVASAASGSGSSSAASPPRLSLTAAPSARSVSQPWGAQRSDETLLTGDTLAKVRAVALAKVSGGTIVRVETDADGHAAYEAHMTKADGTPVTVYVDQQLAVVSVETR
jgi:peptidase YpeB-like protein